MSRRRRIAIVINLNWTMKHHQEVFAGTQQYAREQGWESVLWPYAPEVATRNGKRLYNGIIARVTPQLSIDAAAARIPLVNVWVSSPVWSAVPSVVPDVRHAGQMAAEHLTGRGFRRFGFVGYSRVEVSRRLDAGFRDVIRSGEESNYSRLLVSATFSDSKRAWSRFQSELKHWISQVRPPVGILVVNDKVARYVANAALAAGLQIPGEVAIVGIENEEIICRNPDPSLTSIELGFRHVGEQAAALLGGLMNGTEPPAKPVLLPPVMLVPRRSSDAFSVDDEYVAMALRFITEESHQPIKVRDVAAHVPLSLRSLERRFKESRGCTINSEIARFRIERAKRILTDSDLLVKQVAESCGFANTRRFCEVFQRTEGISPVRYRQKHLGPHLLSSPVEE